MLEAFARRLHDHGITEALAWSPEPGIDRAFSTTNNFNRAKTEFLGEHEALVTINDVQGMPSYWVGILEAGMELLGVTGTVVVDSQRPPEATLRVTWK